MYTFIPKTNQEAFDAVVAHLQTMTERSMMVTSGRPPSCAYTSESGSHCAIGALIDSTDFTDLDQVGDSDSSIEGLSDMFDLGDLSLTLLTDLQKAHDHHGNWDCKGFFHWVALSDIAELNGLSDATVPS